MVSNKGKEVAGKYAGKGKRPADSDEAGDRRKRNRGAVQFFEDAAYEVGDDDDDDVSDISGFGDWDFFEDEFEAQTSKANNEPGKAHGSSVPLFPKEEELSEEELEKMVEERYRPGSSYVTYADDRLSTRIAVDGNEGLPSYKEPTVWKVKCMIGRERQSVFCLMQKYVEFKSLGNKLQIISAFSIEHVKGFIYIEAEKQSDINEACKGVTTIYSSRVAPVPKNEVSSALSVRSRCNEVSVGSWARVKNGKYKGDLAQVIAVNDSQRKATVKLIPRIDLQALAEKYGGGVRTKKSVVPAPRFVTSTELEEFRPLIQYRRDRESGLAFEVLDGMMLKDGYLYKKVSIDSLSLYGVIPSDDELLKFESSKNEVPDCQEWLTELYGEKKKEPPVVKSDKGGGGKGEGSSSSCMETRFEVNDLVLFNRKDFGVIVGSEKEEYYKILKEGSEGQVVVTIDVRQLKKASFENRFTALDKRKKMISINDTVRILEGPLEGRQGNVKHIYRGIIFLHDEVEQENNGYFCCKSQICEKVKFSDEASKGKDGESSFPSFVDPPTSPQSPLAPEKPWETRGRNINREGQEGMFTVGQSLRIRVGPLKGYLCRVLAIRRTDVTVKLDSQHKIFTVKSEHLAEVRGRNSAIPMSDDKDAKPFDLLGNPDGSADWMTGAGTSADSERSSWPAFPSSAQLESNSAMETDNKDEEGGGWGSKVTAKPSSTWGNAGADSKFTVNNEQAGGWGNGGGNWGKPKTSTEDQAGSSHDAGGWGSGGSKWGSKPKPSTEDQGGSSQDAGGNWGSKPNIMLPNDATSTWGKKDNAGCEGPLNSWDKRNTGASEGSNWGKSAIAVEKVSSDGDVSGCGGGWEVHVAKPMAQAAAWGKSAGGDDGIAENWGKTDNKKVDTSPSWGKNSNAGGSQGGSWGKTNMKDDGGAPLWGKTVESPDAGQGGGWGKSSVKKDDGALAWGKIFESSDASQGGTWGKSSMKNDDGAAAWGKTAESSDDAPGKGSEDDSWGKASKSWGNKDDSGGKKVVWNSSAQAQVSQGGGWSSGGSSWGRQGGGSSWAQKNGGNSEGFGGWNRDSGDQQDTYDGGHGGGGGGGGGGRRGRGGWRGSGRGGRSFSEDDRGGERGGFGGGRGGGGWSDRGGRGRWRGSGRGGRLFGEDDQGEERGSFGGGRDGGGWSDRGGRGGSDRGGFRGRGRSDWGGGSSFGGRGRGGRDENSDWSNNQDNGRGDRGQSWGSGGGWSKGNVCTDGDGSGGGSWNKSGPANGNHSSGWGAPKETNGASGWSGGNSKGSGSGGNWNKTGSTDGEQPSILGPHPGPGSGNNSGGGSWNKTGSTDGGQYSGWGTLKGANEGRGSGGQWGKSAGGGSADRDQASVWGTPKGANEGLGSGGQWGRHAGGGSADGDQSSGWGKPKGTNEGGGSGGQWGKPAGCGSVDRGQSSGWGLPKGNNEGGGGSGGQWGKTSGGSSSWGMGNSDGGSKGGGW